MITACFNPKRSAKVAVRISPINSATYSSLRSTWGQSWYLCCQFDRGVSQTANVSAKSSAGWTWAYHASRCSTKLRLFGFGE